MRDYEKLVKALRFAFDQPCYSCVLGEKCNWGDFCFFKRAADAIEELLAEKKEILYRVEIAENMIAFYQEGKPLPNVPHWISVEDALPKKKVGDEGYNGYLVLSDGEYQIADFAHDKYMQTAYEFHVDGEYDPNITHWMELPPKEVE